MYSNFALTKSHKLGETELVFQQCIIAGNWSMVLSFLIASTCILITFQFDHMFSISVQITAHIATIIFAGLFKIGYVVRCVGLHGLGYRDF